MNTSSDSSILPIVGVFGSGEHEWEPRAIQLGKWLAERGVNLLTGGGAGVMTSVSRAFHQTSGRAGKVIGILPCANIQTPEIARAGYPNAWVEIPIFTHLPVATGPTAGSLSRNPINVLSSNVMVSLPGGSGTLDELRLAARFQKPAIAFLCSPDELPDLPEGISRTSDFEVVRAFVERHLPGRTAAAERS